MVNVAMVTCRSRVRVTLCFGVITDQSVTMATVIVSDPADSRSVLNSHDPVDNLSFV